MRRIQKFLRHRQFIVPALKTKGSEKVKKNEIENGFPVHFCPFPTSPTKQ